MASQVGPLSWLRQTFGYQWLAMAWPTGVLSEPIRGQPLPTRQFGLLSWLGRTFGQPWLAMAWSIGGPCGPIPGQQKTMLNCSDVQQSVVLLRIQCLVLLRGIGEGSDVQISVSTHFWPGSCPGCGMADRPARRPTGRLAPISCPMAHMVGLWRMR